MKGLRTLIRLHRWQLDEKRQKVVALGQLAERLRTQIEALDREKELEKRLATESLEARHTYTAYAEVTKERRQNLVNSLQALERQVVEAQEEVNSAFQDVKRHELVLANREKQAQNSLARREQANLDEIALESHRRRSGK